MPLLAKAPLIEVIFELRWGVPTDGDQPRGLNERSLSYQKDEIDFFPGQFHVEAAKNGFVHVESLARKELFDLPAPFSVKFRFRKAPNSWPCYQIGLGILTVNITKRYYQGWEVFKDDILLGLQMLHKIYPGSLTNLPLLGIDLRYLDGFPLDEHDDPISFVNRNLELNLSIPEQFEKSDFFKQPTKKYKEPEVSFSLPITIPKGIAIYKLQTIETNGLKSIITDTNIRSAFEDLPARNIDDLSQWLNSAHEIQHFLFNNLLKPNYMESLK